MATLRGRFARGCAVSAGRFRLVEDACPQPSLLERRHFVDNARVRNTNVSGGRASASGNRPSLVGHSVRRTSVPGKASRARTFGETLRKIRLEQGASQDDLSRLSGVDRSAISNYERGLREPNLRSIVRLARALKIDPAALLRDL